MLLSYKFSATVFLFSIFLDPPKSGPRLSHVRVRRTAVLVQYSSTSYPSAFVGLQYAAPLLVWGLGCCGKQNAQSNNDADFNFQIQNLKRHRFSHLHSHLCRPHIDPQNPHQIRSQNKICGTESVPETFGYCRDGFHVVSSVAPFICFLVRRFRCLDT